MTLEAFISTDDLSSYMGATIEEDDALAVMALDAACQAIRTYTNQTLNLVEEDELTVNGRHHQTLLLPELPVWEVHSVEIDDEEVTDWYLSQAGVLYRVDNVWPTGIGNVTVTYSHGWAVEDESSPAVDADPMPSDLRMVAVRIAAGLYRSPGARFDGIRQISLGDFSATYAAESTGLIETPMKLILDRYAVKGAA